MKNKHLPHLEELFFDYGVDRTLWLLKDLIYRDSDIDFSIKYDGAPAFLFGLNPENKKFFVGTKSALSGKLYYSEDEIYDSVESPELAQKLAAIYNGFSNYIIPGYVFQGDLLWHHIQKTPYGAVECTPNTLRYVFPNLKNPGDIGVVLHTIYTGDTIQNLSVDPSAEYYFRSSEYITVISTDVVVNHRFRSVWNDFELLKRKSQTFSLDKFKTGKLNALIKQYINHCIRNSISMTGWDFKVFLTAAYNKAVTKLKTEKGINN
jgi:hypothetical protein